MNKLILLFSFVLFGALSLQAQTIEELKAMHAEKSAMAGDLSGQLGAIQGEIDALQKEIDLLSGWRTGLTGIIGFDLNKSNGWASSPNPDASSSALNIGLTGVANMDKTKMFWNNKLIANKAWQKVTLDDTPNTTSFFGDNGTIDLLNLSSLAGYKLSSKFALSGLGEVNTSIDNLFKTGGADFGIGATWLPVQNMTVVFHPFNYHLAFGDGTSEGALGTKVRVDYFNNFNLAGNNFTWSTTLTSFVPYGGDVMVTNLDGTTRDASLFEYTWLNTISFDIWKGIGVGLGFGLRNSEFESLDTQSFYSLGLSYGI